MPLYEYECEACVQRFEVIHKFSDPPPDVCRKCGKGPVRRLQSSPAFQFKGTGWYVTDYASKSRGGDSGKTESGKSESTSSSTTPESKSSDGASTSEPSTKADASATPSPSSTAKE